MFNKILNILEHYISTATMYSASKHKTEIDIYKDSSSIEISKLLKDSERGNLRFIMNSDEHYILWDADKMVHKSALKYSKLGNEFHDKYDLVGIIFSTSNTGYKEVVGNSIYIYYGSADIFYKINSDMKTPWGSGTEENMEYVREQFSHTLLYRNLKKLGITNIVVGSWL